MSKLNGAPVQSASASDDYKKSGIARNYPTYRNYMFISIQSWLKGKQKDDEAEGLWRIYDTLYDFTDFIQSHPGGRQWLEATKGTDITEPFESHHISRLPEQYLVNYKVRQAAKPRNYTFTMHEHGFYKTLKRRVRESLNTLDYTPSKRTDRLHLLLLLATFAFAVASAVTGSILLQMLAGLALCWLTIAAHNYFHRKDNWQMYTFNLSFLNFATWRISHALSHHVYTNSLHDLEMSLFEPFLCWIPNKHYATKLHRILSVLLQPIIYALIFPASFLTRLINALTETNVLYWHDTIAFILPTLMLIVSKDSTLVVLIQWMFIIMFGSVVFSIIGLNAAHHDPKIYHDGDANRVDRDWGLYQLDTVIDRDDIKGSQFMVLTHFGDHALHHMFPTLDHGVLPQLYPIFWTTLREFGVQLRAQNHLQHIIGQNKQLLRTEANQSSPGSKQQ